MVTVEEEAWRENFIKDLEKIAKEIASALNALLPRDMQVSAARTVISNATSAIVLTLASTPKNPQIKWAIQCVGGIGKNRNVSLKIPVSHQDVYTKKELERARNSLLKKLEELLNNANADDFKGIFR